MSVIDLNAFIRSTYRDGGYRVVFGIEQRERCGDVREIVIRRFGCIVDL